MKRLWILIPLLLASVCQAGPRERIVIVNTLLRVRLESVPDLPNDFDKGQGLVPPPLALVPPEQATTEPDDVIEFYSVPGCADCEKFVKDWKSGKFNRYAVRSMGAWDGQTHPIWRWRVGPGKYKWITPKMGRYQGPQWLIEGIESVRPKPRKKPVAGIVAWTFSVPSQLWRVGNDTREELIEHLLRDHNTVGFTRGELNCMTREQLVGLHSAAHAGTVRRR